MGKEELVQIWFTSKVTRTSQMGRLYAYLNSLSSREKGRLIEEALSSYHLVEALLDQGLRSREDIKQIGYKKAQHLVAQARSVLYMSGNDPQSLSLGGGIQLTSGNAHASNQMSIAEEQSVDASASLNVNTERSRGVEGKAHSTPEEGKEESNVEKAEEKPKIKKIKLKDEDEDDDDDDDDESSEGLTSFLEDL